MFKNFTDLQQIFEITKKFPKKTAMQCNAMQKKKKNPKFNLNQRGVKLKYSMDQSTILNFII